MARYSNFQGISVMTRFPPLLVLSALAAATGSVHGQSLSAAPADERFTVKISAFDTDSRIQLGARGKAEYDGLSSSATWDANGEIQGDRIRPHLQAMFRMTDRQRLTLGYYQTGQGNRYDFDRDWALSSYEDFFEEDNEFSDLSGSVNADGGFDIDFRLANLMYEYAFFQNDTWSLAGGIGITWADLELNARAQATGEFDGDVDTIDATYQWRRTKWAPTLGLRGMYAPTGNWRFTTEAQGFQTNWGNFVTESGHFERFAINGEYRFTRNYGVHLGYDWFRLKLSDDIRGGFNSNELTYTGRATGDLRVHGPTVGLTVAF